MFLVVIIFFFFLFAAAGKAVVHMPNRTAFQTLEPK